MKQGACMLSTPMETSQLTDGSRDRNIRVFWTTDTTHIYTFLGLSWAKSSEPVPYELAMLSFTYNVS